LPAISEKALSPQETPWRPWVIEDQVVPHADFFPFSGSLLPQLGNVTNTIILALLDDKPPVQPYHVSSTLPLPERKLEIDL